MILFITHNKTLLMGNHGRIHIHTHVRQKKYLSLKDTVGSIKENASMHTIIPEE